MAAFRVQTTSHVMALLDPSSPARLPLGDYDVTITSPGGSSMTMPIKLLANGNVEDRRQPGKEYSGFKYYFDLVQGGSSLLFVEAGGGVPTWALIAAAAAVAYFVLRR